MNRDPGLAAWLIKNRREIEQSLAERSSDGLPASSSAEAEALRRFRSFAASCLQRGELSSPSLDGLKVDDRRLGSLLGAWCEASAHLACDRGPAVRAALDPLSSHFCASLRATGISRRRRGAARTGRRAVLAAIDRISDAFLAIDPDTGRILDANPAAAALLGLQRDSLLGKNVAAFLPDGEAQDWATQIDAVAEGGEPARFYAGLRDEQGLHIPLDVSVTRHATRKHTLALVVARPDPRQPSPEA